ncbi:AsmA family protein [Aquisalimonas asiatica]|uniref:Uncharacterized protein involved in outer membrane biogenesis n=1 Tax=Aquisalimonas asiatica TaxID=406100 RepID=A0A1H8Q2R6_9GAMM|nr:AsmA family protein [Aquisalimonas asiatica]SEO48271.1 Uncharacterized protein involved in outer membrane biogenesis [Aquisalimonas asiatica]
MPTVLRRIALSLLTFLALVGLAVVAAWWFLDPNDHREAINRHASEALGHPVAVQGDIRLELLPRPAVTIDAAVIANADGDTDAPFAEASDLHAAIQPVRLFTGRLALNVIDVGAITLRPERNADGDGNWAPIMDAILEREDDPPLAFDGVRDTRIGRIAVDYTNHQRGTRHRLGARDLALERFTAGGSPSFRADWQAEGAPFNRIDGDLVMQLDLDDALIPRAVELTDLRLEWTPDPDRPDSLQADVSADLAYSPDDNAITLSQLTMSSDALDARLQMDGTWGDDGVAASGTFTITDDALRDRLHTLFGEDPDAEDLDALQWLHAEGSFQWRQQRLALDALHVELDDSTLEADVDARLGSDPLWEFAVGLDAIDLDRYTPEGFDPDTLRTIARTTLGTITGVGLDGTVTIDDLRTNGLAFESIEGVIRSQGDELTIQPLEASVYGGRYHGTFNVPLNGVPYTVWFDQRIDGMALEPALTALFDWAVIEAETDTHWSGSFTGMHWPEIRDSLDAEGTLAFNDGRINHFSLTRLIEDTVPSALGGIDQAPFTRDATTPFDRIAGELAVADGVLTNPEARAGSDYFSVGGAGDLDLSDLELDYRIDLTIIDAFETESEELLELLRGVTIPLRLHGPLTELDVQFDLEQALGDDGDDDVNEDGAE